MRLLPDESMSKDWVFNGTVSLCAGLVVATCVLVIVGELSLVPWLNTAGSAASLVALPLAIVILVATVVDALQNEKIIKLQRASIVSEAHIHDFLDHLRHVQEKLGPRNELSGPPKITIVVSSLSYGMLECENSNITAPERAELLSLFRRYIESWLKVLIANNHQGAPPQIRLMFWQQDAHEKLFGYESNKSSWESPAQMEVKGIALRELLSLLTLLREAHVAKIDVQLIPIAETHLRAFVVETHDDWRGLVAQVSPISHDPQKRNNVRFLSYRVENRESGRLVDSFIHEHVSEGWQNGVSKNLSDTVLPNPKNFIRKWFGLDDAMAKNLLK